MGIVRRRGTALAVVSLVTLLTACAGSGEEDGDKDVRRAQAVVDAKQKALSRAETELAEATQAFCGTSREYVEALDRYGDVLTATAPTVGDVKDAGKDLSQPGQDAVDDAEAAVQARADVEEARQDLAEARTDLAVAKGEPDATTASSPTPTPSPLAPPPSVARVEQAEADFEAAQSGLTDQTPLAVAAQDFNAAAVAVEMAWLGLFDGAGCLTGKEQEQAYEAVREYSRALQDALATAGYYEGQVDGVYGPETTAAVESLQQAHGLPVTGTVDKATAAALQADVLAAGGQAAQDKLVATTALQQTLKLAGFWDGPVDGVWTPALTHALEDFQAELGVKPTGTVDAATVAALEKAIREAQAPDAPTRTPSTPAPSPAASSASEPAASPS